MIEAITRHTRMHFRIAQLLAFRSRNAPNYLIAVLIINQPKFACMHEIMINTQLAPIEVFA